MASQARIIFSAEHSSIKPAVRYLTLSAASPVALIGRASKSISKGLFSAADNAWFDSPVMSRDHAQITLKTEDMTVTLQDIGSMHGTYLNGKELTRHVPEVLNNGDIVVFGAEVRRGPETFPACRFSLVVELVHFVDLKNTGTFAFPESSDIEDEDELEVGGEDDYGFSENDRTAIHRPSSEDGVSIESQPPNARKFNDAIDLTQDDPLEKSNRIDLTRETPSENEMMDDLAGHQAESGSHTHFNILAGNAPIDIESEDERFDAASIDAAEQSEDGFSDSDSSEDYNTRLDEGVFPGSDESEVESQSEEMVIDDSYEVDSAHNLSDVEETNVAPINDAFTYARTHQDDSVFLSDIQTRSQLPDSVAEDEDEDNESEFGLSEAGEAGLKALIDGGLLQNNIDAASKQDRESESESDLDSDVDDAPEVVVSAAPKVVETSASPEELSSLSCPTSAGRFRTLQNFTGHSLGPSYAIRLPSPSDAAMVKGPTTSKQSRDTTGVSELGIFGKSTAEALGNKTGKTAFFEAREVNKAKFDTGSNQSTSGSIAPLKSATHPSFGQSESQTINNVETDRVASLGNITITTSLGPTLPTRDTCSFLDKPDQTRVPPRVASPQLDMTSAYSYNASKNSAAAAAVTPTNSRGIKIDDIIEPPQVQRSSKLKRKADEISSVTDKELHLWAKASSASHTPPRSTLDKATTKSQGSAQIPRTLPVRTTSTESLLPEARPRKRIKKLLENVGYAALGGVAVGAGLFTALVATAPDFL